MYTERDDRLLKTSGYSKVVHFMAGKFRNLNFFRKKKKQILEMYFEKNNSTEKSFKFWNMRKRM